MWTSTRGGGSGSCGFMWIEGGESKTWFFVDIINGWPLRAWPGMFFLLGALVAAWLCYGASYKLLMLLLLLYYYYVKIKQKQLLCKCHFRKMWVDSTKIGISKKWDVIWTFEGDFCYLQPEFIRYTQKCSGSKIFIIQCKQLNLK